MAGRLDRPGAHRASGGIQAEDFASFRVDAVQGMFGAVPYRPLANLVRSVSNAFNCDTHDCCSAAAALSSRESCSVALISGSNEIPTAAFDPAKPSRQRADWLPRSTRDWIDRKRR